MEISLKDKIIVKRIIGRNKEYLITMDNDLVKIWKSKNTKYYDNAIQCWTIRDVNKRNIAKKNNLNYIEFWNLNELKTWIKNN